MSSFMLACWACWRESRSGWPTYDIYTCLFVCTYRLTTYDIYLYTYFWKKRNVNMPKDLTFCPFNAETTPNGNGSPIFSSQASTFSRSFTSSKTWSRDIKRAIEHRNVSHLLGRFVAIHLLQLTLCLTLFSSKESQKP